MYWKTVQGTLFIDDLNAFLQKLNVLADEYDVTIQAMDAGKIAGMAHIELAIKKARRAFESGSNVARDPGVEILRYASGKRQIVEAFSMGMKEGDISVVFLVLGEKNKVDAVLPALDSMVCKSEVIDYSGQKEENIRAHFGIGYAETAAIGVSRIPDIVLERVSLVDILK
ncbi:KEOPS complex subunit Cgi121 [Methanohalophilus profundi]|uniref:KEOPS complex subunit Cgi121 n=1 Tax=Methanohalophilus profundi TaxID=2138083 RepID=UPI00101C1B07|nr:KEOPS complex subunit Cgi121 [Methanohalophilus profundi]